MMKKILFFMVTIVLLGGVGCASYKYGKIDVRQIDEYLAHFTTGGIGIAADAYDTPEKAKEGFYVDVTSKNFYPVNIILSNNSNDRIIILRETAELVDASGNNYKPLRSSIMADTCEHNKMAYGLLGFGIFSYMSAEEANRKMANDWREKELPDQLIIQPGRKQNGFLYFQLPEGKKISGCKLILEVEKLETKEKIPFEIGL